MEKAKFSITKSKKGDFITKLIFENKREYTLQKFEVDKIELLNGKNVEVERDKGHVVKVIMEGKEIFSKTSPTTVTTSAKTVSLKSLEMNHASNITNHATAPYNFVPLNKTPISAKKVPDFDKYYIDDANKRYTGYIELNIETKTPIYIRGTLTEDELKTIKDSKKKPAFFSPVERIRIPGSSLRGMVRMIVEIMSYGNFEFFENKRLYYRAVADKSALGECYRSVMINDTDNFFPKIRAGIIKKNGRNYMIHPSKELPVTNGTQIYRINDSSCATIITRGSFIPKEVYFNPVSPTVNPHRGGDLQLKYALLSSVSAIKDANHPNRGYLVAAGHIGGKHMYWVINEDDDTKDPINICDNLLGFYNEDKDRKSINILKKLEEKNSSGLPIYPDGFPCFYIEENGEIISFGHTGMFRLAYKNTIKAHIPTDLTADRIDIAKALFGNEKTFSGRAFFEDAFLQNATNDDDDGEKVVTLLGPKPTTFQHYLIQTKENMENHPRNLAHYDSNPMTAIRGHKLYWHKENPKYKNGGFNLNTDTKIKPVKKDKTFTGRIRFENLSRVELGAMLSAIDLPKDCCHKIGMGKPLGLGSVKITPTLHLSDRKARYESLEAEWQTGLASSNEQGEKIDDFKKDFGDYILKGLGESGKTFWQLDRMKELEKMLKFPGPADNKTDYMPLGKFRERKVLPKPTEVE